MATREKILGHTNRLISSYRHMGEWIGLIFLSVALATILTIPFWGKPV